jgi:ABC-type transporter MlaC component
MTGNWENIFQYAAGVYQTVQEIVEEVSDVLQGQELADEEVVWKAGASKKGFVYLSMRMSLDAMFEARELSPAQQEMFKQALHTELERYLDSLLAITE